MNVVVEKNKLDILANAIANKSGESLTLTLEEMVSAVDGIEIGGITPSGNLHITENGTGINVTNYSTVSVNVNGLETATATMVQVGANSAKWEVAYLENGELKSSIDIPYDDVTGVDVEVVLYNGESVSTLLADAVYDIQGSATYNSSTGVLTITGNCVIVYEGVDTTPTLIPLNATQNGTYDPSYQDADGYSSVTVNVSGGSPTIQSLTVTPTTSQQTFNSGSVDGYKPVVVNAMPSGTATAPTSISGTSATVSTGTNTLTLSKTVSVTPRITTAGYISSGTAGNSDVSLTANVTTKGTATITPTTSNQTIASGTYLTGTQTISGDANLVAGNIKSGTKIFGVTGTYSGGGSLTVATKTVTHTATSQTLSFSSLSGQPKYWFLRATTNVSSSGSTTYYYVTDCFYDGTNIKGNTFRIGSTRRVQNITSGITQSYSGNTLTITAGSVSTTTPGQFYGASSFGYELVYIY